MDEKIGASVGVVVDEVQKLPDLLSALRRAEVEMRADDVERRAFYRRGELDGAPPRIAVGVVVPILVAGVALAITAGAVAVSMSR